MIKTRVFNLIGYILFFLGLSMLFSAAWSFYYNQNDFFSILNATIITSLTGLILILITKLKLKFNYPFIKIEKSSKFDLSSKDGYVLVTLSWILMSLFSALPYYLYSNCLVDTHPFNFFVNCFFYNWEILI